MFVRLRWLGDLFEVGFKSCIRCLPAVQLLPLLLTRREGNDNTILAILSSVQVAPPAIKLVLARLFFRLSLPIFYQVRCLCDEDFHNKLLMPLPRIPFSVVRYKNIVLTVVSADCQIYLTVFTGKALILPDQESLSMPASLSRA